MLLAYQLYLGPRDGLQPGKLAFWFGLDVFLLWRIWRGGRISWWVLVVLDSLVVVELVVGQVWPWGWYGTGLLAILSAQLLLLLSPAVRRRDPQPGPDSHAATSSSSALN